MTEQTDDRAAQSDSLQALAVVAVPVPYRVAVGAWLGIFHSHAETFLQERIADAVEPAPVFRA